MIRILQSPWVASLIGVLIYCACTVILWQPKQISARSEPEPILDGGPSWEFQNPEVDELIIDLQRQKQALAKRSADLDALADRLEVQRQEIDQSAKRVAELQARFDSNVVQVLSSEATNLKKLAKTYAAMKPDTAASILAEMDEGMLLRLLSVMRETETAPILSAMAAKSPQRVATLSERLRLVLEEKSPTK